MSDFDDFFYTSADGLRLHVRLYGVPGDALPVVCLPGLTRNVRDFHGLALFLSQDTQMPRRVIACDYRGRGQSAYAADWRQYTVGNELADVVAGLEALDVTRALFVGTSRGGLITQVLATVRPDLIAGAVLNDIGPVVDAEGLDHIRSYLGSGPKPGSVAEAIAAQKRVHGSAFPALSEEDWSRMVGALYRIEDGKPVPDYDPELVRTLAATTPGQPMPTLWPQFEALAKRPVLVIRGENSKLLSRETVAAMLASSPLVESITVAGQGHAPFLETGDLPSRIATFLNRAETRA